MVYKTKFRNHANALTLALFMLGCLTDYHNFAFSADDLAFFADLLYRRFNFHLRPSCSPAPECPFVLSNKEQRLNAPSVFIFGFVKHEYAVYFPLQVILPRVRS